MLQAGRDSGNGEYRESYPAQKGVVLVVGGATPVPEVVELLAGEYQVREVAGGQEAVSHLRSHRIDVVLLGIRSTEQDDDELQLIPRVASLGVPVIVLADAALPRTAVTAMKLGAHDFLTSPIERENLLRSIRSALESSRKRQLEILATQAAALSRTDLPRLLLVGGEVGTRAVATVALRHSFAVATAATVAEAIGRMKSWRADLLILEIVSPTCESRRLVNMLRREVPDCAVILTSPAPEAEVVDALAPERIDSFVKAPVHLDRLWQSIVMLLTPTHGPLRVSRSTSAAALYVARHYRDAPGVHKLARAAGLGPRTLQRRFKAELGTTGGLFVDLVQVEVAKHFLWRSDAMFSKIAELAGFCDTSHMLRQVYRHSGRKAKDHRHQPQLVC